MRNNMLNLNKVQKERIMTNANIFLSRVMTLDELSKVTGTPKEQLEYEFKNFLVKISPEKYQSVNRIMCYLSSNYEGYF